MSALHREAPVIRSRWRALGPTCKDFDCQGIQNTNWWLPPGCRAQNPHVVCTWGPGLAVSVPRGGLFSAPLPPGQEMVAGLLTSCTHSCVPSGGPVVEEPKHGAWAKFGCADTHARAHTHTHIHTPRVLTSKICTPVISSLLPIISVTGCVEWLTFKYIRWKCFLNTCWGQNLDSLFCIKDKIGMILQYSDRRRNSCPKLW